MKERRYKLWLSGKRGGVGSCLEKEVELVVLELW